MLNPSDFPPIIKSFVIEGLHGDRDIEIKFDSSFKVLLGENGIGKTTFLNIIYAVLSEKFDRLLSYQFNNIILFFENKGDKGDKEESLRINQQEIIQNWYLENDDFRRLEYFRNNDVDLYKKILENLTLVNQRIQSEGRLNRSSTQTKKEQKERQNKDSSIKRTNVEIKDKIQQKFPYKTIYFPTYRRIEEDLKNLGYSEKDLKESEQLIKFGMDDVKKQFERITAEIKNSSVEWYSKISGQILETLIDPDQIQVDESMRKNLENKEAINIVLDRIGKNISEEGKSRIRSRITNLVENQEELDDLKKYKYLIYHLSNLLKVYEQQKEKDNVIKTFSKVCNKYLLEKEVVYDESKVELKIMNQNNQKEVDLAKLSSGEKQIVSIFSKIYLENEHINELAIILDEPELSLSVEWQKDLLPDIIASNKCKFLLATTHSPFIFENDLDRFVSGISVKYR